MSSMKTVQCIFQKKYCLDKGKVNFVFVLAFYYLYYCKIHRIRNNMKKKVKCNAEVNTNIKINFFEFF